MIEMFKDRYKLGLAMATLFLIGIMASAYQIYRLPHNLRLSDGYHPALFNVYMILGLTFIIGAFTVWSMLSYKNEIVVYRDRQLDKSLAGKDSTESDKASISLDYVKDSLKQAKNQKDILHNGILAVSKQIEAGQGAIYLLEEIEGRRKITLKSGYALNIAESVIVEYEVGEGLIGQAAATGKTLYLDDVPEGYIKIISGLGSSSPRYLLIAAIKNEEKVSGIIEIASFIPLNDHQRKFVEDSAQLIGDKISGKQS